MIPARWSVATARGPGDLVGGHRDARRRRCGAGGDRRPGERRAERRGAVALALRPLRAAAPRGRDPRRARRDRDDRRLRRNRDRRRATWRARAGCGSSSSWRALPLADGRRRGRGRSWAWTRRRSPRPPATTTSCASAFPRRALGRPRCRAPGDHLDRAGARWAGWPDVRRRRRRALGLRALPLSTLVPRARRPCAPPPADERSRLRPHACRPDIRRDRLCS